MSHAQLTIGMLAPCPFPTHQGTQVLIRHLATALARAGHEVHFVTYGYGEYEPPKDSLPFHMHRAGNINAGLRSGPNLKKPVADAALLLTAMRVAKSHPCDLWHAHNFEGLALGSLLKLRSGLPLVYHAHNAMGPELPTYFRSHVTRLLAAVTGDLLDRTLPRAADAVITFDPDHKSLHEVYGVPNRALHVIPPGLDGREVSRPDPTMVAELRTKLGDGPLLLYAGNPDRYQNLSLMWAAFAKARKTRPNLRLLIASEHSPDSFAAERGEAGSPEGVVSYQYHQLAELCALYALAEVGLSPRTIWTGAPIKILNYMAAGLQVVACRSAARHILSAGSGLLVEDNADAFAAGILEVLDHPIGNPASRRRAFGRFRIDKQVPLYEAVYDLVLESRWRHRPKRSSAISV